MSSEVILFWRPNEPYGWMSNWSAHEFRDEHGRYATAEHFLMHRKARMMGDEVTARAVLTADTPAGAKSLGRRVRPWYQDRWDANKLEVMCEALRLKVKQHPGIASSLVMTDDALIAEASPYDTVWGIGLEPGDPRAQNPANWRGTNVLGKAWMIVREELKRSSGPRSVPSAVRDFSEGSKWSVYNGDGDR